MAQCEAEGRKHPTMDLYAGIFNSKLYASSRGTARGNTGDKWSRHAFNSPTAKTENVREDATLSGGNYSDARSLSHYNHIRPEISAGTVSSPELSSVDNEGQSWCFKGSRSVDAGHGGTVNMSLVLCDLSASKAGSMQGNGDCGASDRRSDSGTDNGQPDKDTNIYLSNAGNVSMEPVRKANAAISTNCKSSLSAQKGIGILEKPAVHKYVNNGKDHNYLQNGDCYYAKESSTAVLDSACEWTDSGRHTSKFEGRKGNGTAGNVSFREKCISNGGRQASNDAANQELCMGGKLGHQTFNQCVSDIHVGGDKQGNGYTRKTREHHVANASSSFCSVGVKEQGKPGDWSAARSSFASGASQRFEQKRVPVATSLSLSDAGGVSQGPSRTADLLPSMLVENHHVDNTAVQENDVRALQSGRKDFNDSKIIHDDKAIVTVSNANAHIQTGTKAALEGTSNNLVATLRVKSSASTDSSSSQGGSSHSGSPTAAENCRDIRAPSFGNILFSKGSPRSASSRSVGSSTFLGSSSNAPTKSSSIDSPASQFRYCTSSGRKSAELVPSRRYTEIVPNRKSSEMMSNICIRGAARQDGEAYSVSGSANFNKGSGSTGSSTSVGNGNLVVGSGNGGVRNVGGSMKSVSKQVDAVNRANLVDSALLRKAHASTDPEEVKNAGNEYYRRGQYSEALMLYTRAVSLSPTNALYKCNRAAAFSATGQLGKAVKELEDAIRLDSSYIRARQQVASLYVRLGLLERAKQHLIATGQQSDILEAQRLHTIDEHIYRCIEARKHCEWQSVIKESDAAVVAGADSAPQIFGFKSEALLGLQRPEEADGVCTAAQRVESSLVRSTVIQADPFLLIVRAQVDMALGRFDGALEAAKSAAKLDPCNENVSLILRKAQCVGHARTAGNEMFKAGRFFEALALYAEGLENDPMNAILLCNRAACRSKLGQWEKAVEDCNAALRIQPHYTKALMRRANCWTKLERWEDALQDYEFLRRKMPEDQEVARGLFDVQVAMKKMQGEDTHKMKFGGDVEEVVSDEQFQESITSPGLSVVQFVTKWSERCRQLAPFVDDLCKRNPSVNFLRVDVEDHPCLAKFECVSFIPTFKIYRSGQKLKEILGPTEQSLEHVLKHYSL